MLQRKKIPDTTDVRIVQDGEDIATATSHGVVYPGELGLKVVQSFNACERMREELDEAHAELARHRAKRSQLKTINLGAISRNSHILWTHIRFEDYYLREALKDENRLLKDENRLLNWLEFGECSLDNGERRCSISARLDGSKYWGFDHKGTPLVVYIELLGLQFKFMENHVSYFDAHITPDPTEIKVYPADFDPQKVDGVFKCDDGDCHEKEEHWLLPDGMYHPPQYELAHVVAGKRISIEIGPRWDVIEGRDGAPHRVVPVEGEVDATA
jgi:hypothetical protein